MKGQANRRPGAAKKTNKPAAGDAVETIETFAGRLDWKEGGPVLSWEAEGRRLTAMPDPAHLSPALRQPAADETLVSFEIADGAPIHIRKAGDKWRVMASVLGGTPAVITETLQELYRRRFAPDEIVIFTTTVGERGLDDRFDRNLRALCDEAGVAVPDYRQVAFLRDAAGNPLSDIRSDSDNVAAANVITNRVRELTRYPESVIHASVAGGRKTMGTLLSDAMSLFGRGADAVSHVLVQPEAAERAANFYYRPGVPFALRDRTGEPIRGRDGRELTTDDVSLDLANKPFFRLRGLIDEPVLADMKVPIDFADVTAAVNVTVNRPKLIIHTPRTREVEILGLPTVKLRHTQYALFRVLAEHSVRALRRADGDVTLSPNDFWRMGAKQLDPPPTEAALAALRPAARRYVELLKMFYPRRSWADFIESSSHARSVIALWRCGAYSEAMHYIEPVITRANNALSRGVGVASAAHLYQIKITGPDLAKRFQLSCDPVLIELRD